MELNIYLDQKTEIKMDNIQFQKMSFIMNAINDGWIVKKDHDSFVFTKPHHGKEEIYKDDYLTTFIRDNINYKKLLS